MGLGLSGRDSRGGRSNCRAAPRLERRLRFTPFPRNTHRSGLLVHWTSRGHFMKKRYGLVVLPALLGVAASIIWAAGWATWHLAWSRGVRGMDAIGQEQIALHRRFIRRLDHEL